MEKEAQPDSITTVTIKPDYPPSEVYSSEPPPAYHRSQSSAVQLTKIVAATVVLVSFILGSFILASAYVTATASCKQLERELELFNEAADRFQSPLAPEALVQEESHYKGKNADALHAEESEKNVNYIENNNIDSSNSENSEYSDDNSDKSDSVSSNASGETPVSSKLPLQLDFNDFAEALLERNKKSRMNCVIEKKCAEGIVDHQPNTETHFELNLTTNPRYERFSGERITILCETANIQKQIPDQDEETVMIQPVIIPIGQRHFPTHMADQLRPILQPQVQTVTSAMRPSVLSEVNEQNQFPPNQILYHIAQEIIAQKNMERQRTRDEQIKSNSESGQQYSTPDELLIQKMPLSEEAMTQFNKQPNRDIIVTISHQYDEIPQHSRKTSPGMDVVLPDIPVLREMTPVSQEMYNTASQMQKVLPLTNAKGAAPQIKGGASDEMHILSQQAENAQAITNSAATYNTMVPIHFPFRLQQQGQAESRIIPQELRPHYVQPRSIHPLE